MTRKMRVAVPALLQSQLSLRVTSFWMVTERGYTPAFNISWKAGLPFSVFLIVAPPSPRYPREMIYNDEITFWEPLRLSPKSKSMITVSNPDPESLTSYIGTALQAIKIQCIYWFSICAKALNFRSVQSVTNLTCTQKVKFPKGIIKLPVPVLCMHTLFSTIPLGNQMFTTCGNSQCNLYPLGTWLVFYPQLFGPLCCPAFIEAHCNFQMKCSTLMVIIIMNPTVFATSLSPSLLSFYSLTVL